MQGVIYPVRTDVPLREKTFPLAVDSFGAAGRGGEEEEEGGGGGGREDAAPICDRKAGQEEEEEEETGEEVEAFCRSGDRVSFSLGKVEGASSGDAVVTLTRKDGDRSSSRPHFSVAAGGPPTSRRLRVDFERVSRDDEGAYEVRVADRDGSEPLARADYVLVVLDKSAEPDVSRLLDTASSSSWALDGSATPHLAQRLRTPAFSTPRCTPYASPRATPRGTPRTTPVRSLTPMSSVAAGEDAASDVDGGAGSREGSRARSIGRSGHKHFCLRFPTNIAMSTPHAESPTNKGSEKSRYSEIIYKKGHISHRF